MQTTDTGAANMTVRITRRPTLVDGVVQAGRWWWRNWERYMSAGAGAGIGSTAFGAEGAEGTEGTDSRAGADGAGADYPGYAVADDARFRNLTGHSFLNFGFSASGQGTAVSGARLGDPASNADARRPSTKGGVRRVPPASLILGASAPDSLPRRQRSIAPARSVGSEGSVVKRNSAPSAPSAVKGSSTPAREPRP